MATVLEQVEKAINRGDAEQARELLREELLSNPTAEAYYLASLAAFDEEQQLEFLEKALAIYPFHKKAYLLRKHINEQRSYAAASRSKAERPPQTQSAAELPVEKLNEPQRSSAAEFPYAPISKRISAMLIDSLILLIMGQVVVTVLDTFGLLPPENISIVVRSGVQEMMNPFYWLMGSLLSFMVSSIYYIYFLCEQNGQTPGKHLRGIRIVSLTGSRITRRQALMRNEIGYLISGLFLVGYLQAFWDRIVRHGMTNLLKHLLSRPAKR